MKNKILTILVMIVLCIVLVALTGCSNNDEQNQDINVVGENEYIEGGFEVVKVEKEKFNEEYVITAPKLFETVNAEFFTIEPQEKNFVIKIIESDHNKELIEQGDKVNCNESYEVKNSSITDVMRVFYSSEGQDLMYPNVFLLMTDGTVKGIDIEDGYKTGEFVAYNIPELKNIITIEQAEVHPVDNSGYIATLAISQNEEEIYEIRRKQ